jgi:hypothetical protein
MKTKATITTLLMSFLVTLAFAQWQQVGYMIVNSTDTVNGSSMIRGFGVNVYSCTTKGIFSSNDNGASWNNISYNASVIQNESINCIFVALNGDMYAGSTRRLYKSIDNGSSWTWLNSLPDSLDFMDVSEINGNMVASYRIGFSSGGCYYSNDAGLNWTATTGLPNNQKGRFLVNGNTIYLGSVDGIFSSADNGLSWTLAGTGFSGNAFRDLVKSGNAFFAGDIFGNGLFASYDNAASWANADPVAFNPFCQIFSITESNNIILATMDGTPCNPSGTSPIKMSADTGHSWTVFMNNLPGVWYNAIGRNAAGTSFFTKEGNGKKVYRYDLVLGTTAAELIKPTVSIFPNPVSTNATISISGELKKYSFRVFDLAGEMVSEIQINDSETTFDKGNLAPGIYFYELRDEQQSLFTCGKIIVN